MVAVGCAPSASMRSYTRSACSGWPLRLHALMIVLYVRTSGLVPCNAVEQNEAHIFSRVPL